MPTLLAYQRRTLDAMPDFRRLPLSQLILYCPSLLQAASAETRTAWVELYRRALVEENQAAWDALMLRLWPAILYWIYTYAPDVSPATAERIAQRAINDFKRQQITPPRSDSPLPGYEQLTSDLRQVVARLLGE
ncbi:MAG: hypothetical protein DYG89_33495 [Caldilinea sp. CFX5]|nr:hypothetical protein [Caldilinea sp. CFX5]